MKDMSCMGTCYGRSRSSLYAEHIDDEKDARIRDKEISRILKEHNREYAKRHRILLLGCGESGKSTIAKQMKIIHINGFTRQERIEKIADIRRNIKESILTIVFAMQDLEIPLDDPSKQANVDFLVNSAPDPLSQNTDEFMQNVAEVWSDLGVHECYRRSNEYQLLDCCKYFLDRLNVIRKEDYVPSDQDILRCRVTTTSIQLIEFDVQDKNNQVHFCVYDVGGQRGERKKWIQVFDSAAAILFIVDCGSFDRNLREDETKNRLLESMEIFEQVWRNRFLRNVSCILFINKIDVLSEKISAGQSIADLTDRYPELFPSYQSFTPSKTDQKEFLDALNGTNNKRSSSRSASHTEVEDEVVKTAVYIKHLFTKIVKGECILRESLDKQVYDRSWHQHHSCEYFYTCAVDTNNIQKVLEGCRTIIIRSHLERFGII